MKHIFKILSLSVLMLLLTNSAIAQRASLTINQDSRITTLLDLKIQLEKDNRLTDGYTIQLYYGELNEANSVVKRYRGSFPNWPASIEYHTPNYKVWAGNFSSRLEAERALLEIRNSFNSAFILKPGRR